MARGFRKARDEWEVLLLDHHEGYLSWTEYERNQRLIADNANGTSFMARGAVRRGEMLRCGHCGRKLHVAYSGTKGDVGRYHCRGALLNHGAEIVRLLQPLGIEAAIQAIETQRDDAGEQHRQTALALDQARYEERLMPDGNMMRSIPAIAWWQANWSDAGTMRFARSVLLKSSWTN